MAGKTNENPLLFSANISSPFDDINSAALLIPPSQPPPKVSEASSNELPATDVLSQSLQPHLLKSSSPSPSPSPPVISKPSTTPSPVPSELSGHRTISPSLPPANISQGASFLRRPTNKYVVPPEISAAPLAPPSSSSSPRPPTFVPSKSIPPSFNTFTPTQSLPQGVSTFTPLPNNDLTSTVTNDYSLPTSEGPSVAQFAADLSATAGNQPYQQSMQATVIPASFDAMAERPPVTGELYHPVIPHWFYSEGKPLVWKPYSFTDSLNLEEAYRQGSSDKVATDGGRYDVVIKERKRLPVYWGGEGGAVRRCSWFRKGYAEAYPVPYTEEVAEKLEAEYKDAMLSGQWHRQIELPGGERVMLNSQFSMHHYPSQESVELPNIASVSYPQTVKRGADDFEIKEGASDRIDHLLFLIHGIGSACDFSFRSVEECVDDFRSMGEDLLAAHFKEGIESGQVGRVEILPISWHKALHGDATGLDEKLKYITLRSIPKFREFTNDTLLDVLFYTSPVYCQHIMDTVASEMEKLLAQFRERNPTFTGTVSVGGHSLGSVILFDLLIHQNPLKEQEEKQDDNMKDKVLNSPNEEEECLNGGERISLTSQINFMMGVAGTGQPAIIYPQLSFHPQAFFLMGSPVGMFITVRGIDTLGPSFKLPTCDRVFNIFHPFDPVAYRLETLIDISFVELRPVLIPHHKGRKRMHLELKDTIERVGADIKNKILDSIQSTWNKVCLMYAGEISQAVEDRMLKEGEENAESNDKSGTEGTESHVQIGQLNRGLRVDYVLQEKPYESFTEYIFALQAHVSYWTSEDTLLMILKELYKMSGISPSKPETVISTNSELKSSSSSSSPPPPPPPLPSEPMMGQPAQPSAPVPMFSSPVVASPNLPPPPVMKNDLPRTLRGRPIFDPLKTPATTMGMDPTASPMGIDNLPKPPILPNMKFNRKKT